MSEWVHPRDRAAGDKLTPQLKILPELYVDERGNLYRLQTGGGFQRVHYYGQAQATPPRGIRSLLELISEMLTGEPTDE